MGITGLICHVHFREDIQSFAMKLMSRVFFLALSGLFFALATLQIFCFPNLPNGEKEISLNFFLMSLYTFVQLNIYRQMLRLYNSSYGGRNISLFLLTVFFNLYLFNFLRLVNVTDCAAGKLNFLRD